MKLTQKKEEQLYRVVSNEITEARVKINSLLKHTIGSMEVKLMIDDILYDLENNTPEKAISIFESPPNKEK